MLRDEGRLSRDGRPPKEPPTGAGRQGGPGRKNLEFRLRPGRFRAGRWGRPWGMEEDSWQDGSWPWRRRQGTLTHG